MKTLILFIALASAALGQTAPKSSLAEMAQQGLRGAAQVGYIVGKCNGTEAELEQLMKDIQAGDADAPAKYVKKKMGDSIPVTVTSPTTLWGEDYLKAHPMFAGEVAAKKFYFLMLNGGRGGPSYEFGLRSDGVVVWREVK